MEKTMKLPKSSELYRNIDELKLMPSDRRKALNALVVAEMFVSAGDRLIRLFSSAPGEIPAGVKLKHQ